MGSYFPVSGIHLKAKVKKRLIWFEIGNQKAFSRLLEAVFYGGYLTSYIYWIKKKRLRL